MLCPSVPRLPCNFENASLVAHQGAHARTRTHTHALLDAPTAQHHTHACSIVWAADVDGRRGRIILLQWCSSTGMICVLIHEDDHHRHFYSTSVPTRAKQTPPPTSYSSSEDEEWEDAVDGEDDDDDVDDKWIKRERKESSHSHHLVNNSLSALPEDGKSWSFPWWMLSLHFILIEPLQPGWYTSCFSIGFFFRLLPLSHTFFGPTFYRSPKNCLKFTLY